MNHSPSSISILIIEDNPADAFLLEENLSSTELLIGSVKSVDTLKEASDILRSQSFSLIFLDFFLPDSSGLKSFTELTEINSKIPVIILSGLSDTRIAIDAISLGAQDFLIKGEYSVQTLEKAIRYSIERKKNLETIERNNERYDLMSKATNDIIWDWDLRVNKVLWTGQGLEKYLQNGHTGDVPRDFWSNGLHPDEREKVIESLNKAIAAGDNTWQRDHRFQKKDGTYAHMNTRGFISKDIADKPVRMIGSMQDITERKIAELEMLKAKQEAEEARKIQEQFLANMSHEIRTPMNGIVGMTQLIRGTALSEEQADYVESISESATNLLVIINDILDFTKIVAGKIILEEVDYVFNDIVHSCIKMMQLKAREKGINLVNEIEKNIYPVLCGDPVRLNQILINLVGNAIKFTEQGEVKVSTKILAEDEGNITIEFFVQDTGIGIPADKLSSIFESFTQASSSTTRKYGGTGLGLTITKQLIELQGGKIHIESTPGSGSTFSFYLKIKKGNQQYRIPKENIGVTVSHELSGVHILLVEDNLMNQKVAVKTLARQGAEVDIANNGKEAIIQLNKKEYNIILMDIQMPEMDGFDTTKYIRNEMGAQFDKIPIIAMTASALASEKNKCLSIGMNDYLSKPFVAKDLFDKIKLQLQIMGKD